MSFVYTPALGLLNPTVLTGDIRAALVMSNTTCDTVVDADFLDDFTLDEYDGSGYARQALASEAFAVDLANDRFEFDATDIVFAALGVGTRQAVGLLIFLHVTNAADSKPIAYIDTGGFPFDGNGEDVTVTWNAEGILQIRNAD